MPWSCRHLDRMSFKATISHHPQRIYEFGLFRLDAAYSRNDLKEPEYISSDSLAKAQPVFIRGARAIIPHSTFDEITKL
jgi:hypothetical protein